MTINANHEYFEAEKKYFAAENVNDKIYWLEEMIRAAPKHKSSENFLAELKRRLKKLREKSEKSGKSGKGSKKGIRKEGFLFVLVGKTNSGKSLLHSGLTNAKSLVADYFFTTKKPEVGMFDHFGVKAQVIDLPAVGCENFDYGILNTADCLIFVVEKLSDIDELEDYCKRSTKGRIVVINKADLYLSEEIRKMKERIKSKRINGILVSAATGIGIDELKNRMFGKMDVVRVYTKEPGKNKTKDPIVLKKGSKVRDVAEGIWKGFSKTVRETRLTGPSSKFPNQKVGMNHELRDMDVVEFHT